MGRSGGAVIARSGGWVILAVGLAAGGLVPGGARSGLAQPKGASGVETGAAFFQREIRPLLERRCLGCHDGVKRAGGLELVSRASALRGGNSGPAVAPGHPERSRLFERVARGQMPPTGALPAAELALLRRWIAEGAPYGEAPLTATTAPRGELWSLRPPVWPRVPRVSSGAVVRNPIDAFVLARLEAKGLRSSPPASRRELIRRLTFDLTGLPPMPEDVAAFVGDRSPNAYEKVVDRLLASPHYGERWGRHWLDVVRYGESHGFEQNHLRPNAWPYRDHVIRSFNQDKPYPQFILQQLAGDVVGKGRPEVEVGTGYLVAGVHDTVGNATREGELQKRMDDLDDMVATTGAAFLGLTVGCARCHDHKFDPIPTRDYYRLQAVFAGVRHGEREVATAAAAAERERRLQALREELKPIERSLREIDSRARAALRTAVGEAPRRPAVNVRQNEDRFAPVSARFIRFTVEATPEQMQPCLDELEVTGESGDVNLALASGGARATASSVLPGFAIHQVAHLNDGRYGNDHSWISNEPGGGWAMIELPRPERVARVVWGRDREGKLHDRLPTAYRIETSLDGQEWVTVSRGSDREPFMARELGEEERNRALSAEEREQRAKLDREWERLQDRIEALEAEGRLYVGRFETPGETRICRRGDPMQPGDPVTPGGLSAVPTMAPDLPVDPRAPEWARRLALARWIGSPRNPLTARVMVNRVWQHHFGRAIVGTPSDFGFNGEPPTHPELLDWLALKFMANGWRLKPLHRLIVTSATYRQSSRRWALGVGRSDAVPNAQSTHAPRGYPTPNTRAQLHPPVAAAGLPAVGALHRAARFLDRAWIVGALVERHDDIGADGPLDVDDGLRGEEVRRAIQIALEGDALLGDLPQVSEAEHLEAAAVGKNRGVPAHKAVEPPSALD
jgi:hypothetical protein